MNVKELIKAYKFLKIFNIDINKSSTMLNLVCKNIETLKTIKIYVKKIYVENNLKYTIYGVVVNNHESIFTVCNNNIVDDTLFGSDDEIKLAKKMLLEYLK